jgi:hypothetical protein
MRNTRGAPRGGVGCQVAAPAPKPLKPKLKKKNTDFVDITIWEVLHDLHFSRSQPLKSADDYYIKILKNKLISFKNQEGRTLWFSHGICSYICMYINAFANSVILYLQHDFYNIIFEIIKHKLFIVSGSAPHPPPPPPARPSAKNSGCAPAWQ